MDADDIGVVQCAGGSRLALEAGDAIAVAGKTGRQRFVATSRFRR